MRKKIRIITTIILVIILLIALLDSLNEKKSKPLVFSWSLSNTQTIESEEQRRKEWAMIKVDDDFKYPKAQTKITIWTWLAMVESWDERETIVQSWYIYTSTYKDLWLKISTTLLYQPYFYEKSEEIIIQRNGNILYADPLKKWIISPDYIEVFFKDPKKTFEAEIKEKHLPIWCTIETWILDYNLPFSKHIKWFLFISIENISSDVECKADKQFPSNYLSISFYMNPKKPDRYYKISYGNCAPGPCSIFGDIVFF